MCPPLPSHLHDRSKSNPPSVKRFFCLLTSFLNGFLMLDIILAILFCTDLRKKVFVSYNGHWYSSTIIYTDWFYCILGSTEEWRWFFFILIFCCFLFLCLNCWEDISKCFCSVRFFLSLFLLVYSKNWCGSLCRVKLLCGRHFHLSRILFYIFNPQKICLVFFRSKLPTVNK